MVKFARASNILAILSSVEEEQETKRLDALAKVSVFKQQIIIHLLSGFVKSDE